MSGLLIEAAFAAEKYGVETSKEVREHFNLYKGIGNVVINGEDYPGKQIFLFLNEIISLFSEHKCTVMIVAESDQIEAVQGKVDQLNWIHFVPGPVTKKLIIQVFNPIVPVKRPSIPNQKVEKPAANTAFFEASAHVRDTVDRLKKILSNPKDLESLFYIGQRFNGIIGTFNFARKKPGYAELADLATLIDDIARYYQKNQDKKEIETIHLQLMTAAAKLSYLLLRDLRESKPVKESLHASYQKIMATMKKQEKIPKRARLDQEMIDHLIDKTMNAG